MTGGPFRVLWGDNWHYDIEPEDSVKDAHREPGPFATRLEAMEYAHNRMRDARTVLADAFRRTGIAIRLERSKRRKQG